MAQLIISITCNLVILLAGMIAKYETFTYGKTYQKRHLVLGIVAVVFIGICFFNLMCDIDSFFKTYEQINLPLTGVAGVLACSMWFSGSVALFAVPELAIAFLSLSFGRAAAGKAYCDTESYVMGITALQIVSFVALLSSIVAFAHLSQLI